MRREGVEARVKPVEIAVHRDHDADRRRLHRFGRYHAGRLPLRRQSHRGTADADGNLLIEARQAIAGGDIGVFVNAMRVTAVVPEPGTLALLALGVMAVLFWRRRS